MVGMSWTVKWSNNCELTTFVRLKTLPSHTARFEKSPSRSVPCSVCWLPSWRPHRSITDNQVPPWKPSPPLAVPLSVSFSSTICLVFYQIWYCDTYGSLLHVAAGTVHLHFCARSLGLDFALKHCWITYDVSKLHTVEYKTCICDKYVPNILSTAVITQYLRNSQNIQLSHLIPSNL